MKIKPAYVLLLVFFSLATLRLSAQDKISISGKVITADDRQPIHGVSVNVDKRGIGTATNRAGAFALFIPAANLKDSLRVSCIGYQTRFFAIADLKDGQQLDISLQKNVTQLKEVSVAFYDPAKIIARALASIKKNYINHPHITRGFYRMYTAKGTEPLELSEAVFDIYNFGYTDKRADLFKLIKARDGKNQRDFHSVQLDQKPNTIFNYDIVNHLTSSGFLSDSGVKKHHFEVTGIVDVRGYPAYEVVFSENKNARDDSYRGRFYVDTKTYAFVYFDFGLSPTALSNSEFGNFADKIMVGTGDIDVKLKQDNCKVGYQKIGNKWVLSDVSNTDGIRITNTEIHEDFMADVRFSYQVTAVDTVQTTSFSEKIGRHENINDHDSNADESFWKDYNILLADFNTENIFKHIMAVNNNVKLKDKFEEKLPKLSADTAQRIDAMLKFYNDNGQFNGTALIKSKGKVVLSKSYGYADKAAHKQADSHTVYNIGSTAEVFTSVIISQLIGEGKLDLHAAIKTYIPYYTNGDVMVEQLLTQQSGVADYFSNKDNMAQIVTKSFTPKQMAINFCSDTLGFKSGTEFEYSRSNYVLLAAIAEEVGGKPFATMLQERIFAPLQMTDTYFGLYKGTEGKLAKGYVDNVAQPTYDMGNEAGSGGISSSADDLLKFYNGLHTDKLLTKAQKTELLKIRTAYKEYNAGYGYGWLTDKSEFTATKKHVITYSPGGTTGFGVMFANEGDADTCLILLNNNGDFPRLDMADLLLNMVN